MHYIQVCVNTGRYDGKFLEYKLSRMQRKSIRVCEPHCDIKAYKKNTIAQDALLYLALWKNLRRNSEGKLSIWF